MSDVGASLSPGQLANKVKRPETESAQIGWAGLSVLGSLPREVLCYAPASLGPLWKKEETLCNAPYWSVDIIERACSCIRAVLAEKGVDPP